MANDIVAGLFGLSPSQVQQQQQAAIQQQAAAYAQQAPFERAAAGMYQGGAGLAGIGAGMMGWKNTEVEAAKQREAALSQVDFNTPEGILAAAKAAGDRGDTRMSLQLQMLARQRMAEQQEAEVKTTEMAKNLAQAQKAIREEDAAKQPTSVAEYQYAVSSGYKGTFQEWLKGKSQEGGAAPIVAKLLDERSKYAPNSQEYKVLSDAILKETYIKPEKEPSEGMKPADELRFMNQHGKDYERAVVTIDSSSDALRLVNSIESNPKFGYLFGGYTEKAMSKLAPGKIAGLQSEINTLKSNLMATGLNLVKAANAAGIGAITEKEWPIFERMIADLDPKMDEKTARKKFGEITKFFDRTQKRSAESYKKKWSKRTDFYDPSIEDMVYKTTTSSGATPVKGDVKFLGFENANR